MAKRLPRRRAWIPRLFPLRAGPSGGAAAPTPALTILEDRVLFAAQPVVALSGDPQPFVGDQAQVTITFANRPDGSAGGDVGYAPYIDLGVARNGADGDGPGSTPPNENDGLEFVSATYLGASLDATVVEFDASGQAVHPFARDATGAPRVVAAAAFGLGPGDELVVLRLPFGSVTPGQTPIDVTVVLATSPLADVGTPLPIAAVGGFAFGRDPLNNPTADAPLLGAPQFDTVTPQLIRVSKSYLGPEQETVTGPDYPRAWLLNLDLATGQMLTDLRLTDQLPDGVVPLAGNIVAGPAGIVTIGADNLVVVDFTGAVTGAAGNDVQVRIDFFVGELLAPGDPSVPVLDPVTGAPRTLLNQLSATATWDPLDPRDPPTTITIDPPLPEDVITARALAVQKSVALAVDRAAPGLGPTDSLAFTIDMQVSDFFRLQAGNVRDVLSDGLLFESGFAPVLEVREAGGTLGSGAFDAANIGIARDPSTGRTTLVFDLAAQLAANGADTVLDGRPAGQTTVRLTYRATIGSTYLTPGAGSVSQGDTLSNAVEGGDGVLDDNGTVTGQVEDDSGAGATIATSSFDKTVYAKNGVLVPPGEVVRVSSNDLITFRLRIALPQSLSAALLLDDFLPLPVFNVGGVTFAFQDVVSAEAPGVNVVKWGPDAAGFDALLPGDPIMTTSVVDNALRFDFGALRPATPVATVADLLFTVRAADAPFGDGLALRNLGTLTELDSNGRPISQSGTEQVILAEPALRLTKGVIGVTTGQTEFPTSFSAPVGPVPFAPPGSAGAPFSGLIDSAALSAVPIDADLAGVDAADLVRFAVTLENTGSGPKGAHDILVRDTLPAGFAVPPAGLNLTVYRGDGSVVPFVIEGAGLFDPAGGIRLLDPSDLDPTSPAGALNGTGGAAGSNVGLIVYDLRMADTARSANLLLLNEATIAFYAAVEGGNQFADNILPEDRTDPAQVTTGALANDKILFATDRPESIGDAVLIGESATFRVTLTLREGVTGAVSLTDALPVTPGILSFVSARVVSVGANLGFSGAAPVPGQSLPAQDLNGDGRANEVRLTLDDVTNAADNQVTDADRIVIEVVGLVDNLPQNNRGDVLVNRATAAWTDADGAARSLPDTASVRIVEPQPAIDKTVSRGTGDGGDVVTYTLTITNPSAGGVSAPAFDMEISDLFNDPDLSLVAGTVTLGGTLAGSATIEQGNATGDTLVLVTLPRFDPGQVLTVAYQGRISDTVETGRLVRNVGVVRSDSAPGDVPGQRPYEDSDDAVVTIDQPAIAKAIVATSLADTGTEQGDATLQDVAFGEDVTYEIRLRFAEGRTAGVLSGDQVPLAGLMEIRSAAIVSVGASLTAAGAATPPLLTDTDGDGIIDTALFLIGNVINRPDGVADANDELVYRVVARQLADGGASRGERMVNTAELAWQPVGSGSRTLLATAVSEVVEPILSIAKTADVENADGGDMVNYRVILTNAAGDFAAAAFDLTLSDLFSDPQLDLVAGSVAVTGGATVVQGNAPGDAAITVTLDRLGIGGGVVLTYQGRLTATAIAGTQLVNVAAYAADSHPGVRPGERDYADEAAAVVRVGDSVETKSVVATSLTTTGSGAVFPGIPDLAIGEQVRFEIAITLSEGSVPLLLEDQLPTGAGVLDYVRYRIVPLPANTNLDFVIGTEVATAADTSGDGFRDRLTLDFGTVLNRPDNISDERDVIRVQVTARLVDVPANVAGDRLTNTATATVGGVPVVATADVAVVEPALLIAKSASLRTGDAGDLVTYTVRIAPDPARMTGPAYNLLLQDVLAPGTVLVPGSVTTSRGTIVLGNNAGDTAIRIGVPLVLPDDPAVVVTCQARLTDQVTPGQILTNVAQLGYASAPQFARSYAASDDASVRVALPQALAKDVIATSLPGTGFRFGDPAFADVVIGEVVTYRITARLGEGTQNVVITELPPTDGSVRIESATVARIGGSISGAALQVGDPGEVQADRVRFDFGTLVNAGDNLSNEDDEIAIIVRARVLDVPANTQGRQIVNDSTLVVRSPDLTTSTVTSADQATVEIVEPVLTLEKQGPTGFVAPGEVVTYRLRVAHDATSTAPGYDILLADLLTDPALALVPGSVVTTPGVVVTGNAPGDTTLAVRIPVLQVGLVAGVSFLVRIAPDAPLATLATNTATADFSSAPPGNGGRPGQLEDSFVVPIRPDFTKQIVATSLPETGSTAWDPARPDLAVGEELTYQLRIVLPRVTTTGLVIADLLPDGLLPLAARIVSVGAGLQPATSSIVIAGQRVTATFGDVANTSTPPVTDDDAIVIAVDARVRDIPGVVGGIVLTNAAEATFAIGTRAGALAAQAPADVVEPTFALTKTVTPDGGDAGDLVTFTVVLTPDAARGGPAFGVTLTDRLDPLLVPVAATSTAGTVTLTGQEVGLELGTVLPSAAPVVLTVTARLSDQIEPGRVVPNTAILGFTSAPVAGRPGTLVDSAEVVGRLFVTLDKQVVATSVAETGSAFFDPSRQDVTAGETVTFLLTATLAEGTQRLVLTDILPDGLVPEAARVVALGAGIAAGTPALLIDGQGLRLDFGTVVNRGDNVTDAGDEVVIEIIARLRPGIPAGTILTNTAAATVSAPADPQAPGGTLSATASASVDTVAPELGIDKSVSSPFAVPGQTLTYTIILAHTASSSAPLFDILIGDLIGDPTLRLVPGTVVTSVGVVVAGNSAGDGTVVVRVPLLLPGQGVVIGFAATVLAVPLPDGVARNTATFAGVSAPGAVPSGFVGIVTGQDTAQVLVATSDDGADPAGPVLAAFEDALRRVRINPVPLAAIYTGTAPPGSVVTLLVSDAGGTGRLPISRLTDAGGHWLVSVSAPAAGPDGAALDLARSLAGRADLAPAGPAAPEEGAIALGPVGIATTARMAEGPSQEPMPASVRVTYGGVVSAPSYFAPTADTMGPVLAQRASAVLARELAGAVHPMAHLLNRFSRGFEAPAGVAGGLGR